jgi:hypothetical protein
MKSKHSTSSDLATIEPTDAEERIEAAVRLSDSKRESVYEELRRLIASSQFKSSHRCQMLLRYVVENALKGRADSLKERIIGVEVFGRDLAYDTNNDPVVRMAAGEVRKKLAQYYYDPANQSETRIELLAGSYVPAFSSFDLLPRAGEDGVSNISEEDGVFKVAEVADVKPEKQAETPAQIDRSSWWSRRAIRWLVVGFAVAVASMLLFQQFQSKPPDAFESFWAPVVTSPNPVLLCVGHRMLTWSQYDSVEAHDSSATPTKQASNDDQKNRPVMLLSDSITLTNVTALLRAYKKTYSVRGQAFTRFEDLQRGPVVLLGAFNNNWTMRLMKSMRFHFAEDPNGSRQWIADQEKPEVQIGLVQVNKGDFTTEDYALVARIIDPQTKLPTIIAAGVTATATHAAGDFITNASYLDDFFKKAPQNWQTKNMELLIVVNNVNGDSGPPKVVASYFW